MVLTRVKAYFRGRPTSAAEKKLVVKLDFFILTFCCMAYFMNYLDRSNLSQAYVSGMKEDLNMYGNQLTVINTIYSIGYMIGIIPNNILLSQFKPRIFFPAMMAIWATFTMCTAAIRSPQDAMAIRFFQGYAESCVFAGTHYILGSWYTEEELGKRSGIFTSSGLAGGMFGGIIQSGIFRSMNGLGGLAGWRWLFIIDGLVTLPVAAYGYFLFPDTPSTTTAPYFTAEEKQLAIARVPDVQHQSIRTKAFGKKVFTSWYLYAFALLWILTNCAEAASSNSLLLLYMQSSPHKKYSVYQLNNYPTGVQAMGIASTLLWATATDIFGGRWITNYYIALTGIVSSIIILIPSTSEGGIMGAYYWAGTIYACQATSFAWANDILRHEDNSFRAVVVGFMNFAGNMFQAWWPLLFYATNMAPHFTKGMYAMIAVCTGLAIWCTVMVLVERRKKTVVFDATVPDEGGLVEIQPHDAKGEMVMMPDP